MKRCSARRGTRGRGLQVLRWDPDLPRGAAQLVPPSSLPSLCDVALSRPPWRVPSRGSDLAAHPPSRREVQRVAETPQMRPTHLGAARGPQLPSTRSCRAGNSRKIFTPTASGQTLCKRKSLSGPLSPTDFAGARGFPGASARFGAKLANPRGNKVKPKANGSARSEV